MVNSKAIKLAVAPTLITIIIYFYTTSKQVSFIESELKHGRILFDIKDYNSKCLTADYNFTDVVKNEYLLKANEVFDQYLANFTDSDPSKEATFKNLILNQSASSDDLIEIAKTILAPFIIFLIFAVITLIGWFVCCCCCCCKACCCFRNDSPDEPLCGCQKFSVIAFMVCFLGLIAICIVGYVFSGKLSPSVKSTECSLLKFYLDLKIGQQNETKPYWIGVDNMIIKLNEIESKIDSIQSNSATAFKDTSFVQNDQKVYNSKLDNSYNSIKDLKVTSPNPNSNGKQISPGFIYNFGPKDSAQTYAGILKVEYESTIIVGSDSLNQLKSNTDKINTESEQVKRGIEGIVNNIKPLQSNLVSIDQNYITNYSNFQDDSQSTLNSVFLIFFIVIAALGLVFFLSTIIFICKDSTFFKYVAYLFWYFISLITIPLFILAAVFGTIGTLCIYLDIIFKITFSREGLESLFVDKQQVNILDVCLNKDGDLKPILVDSSKSSITDTLDQFIANSNRINSLYSTYQNSTESHINNYLQNYYADLTNDVGMDSLDGKDYALGALRDYTTLTDSTQQNTEQVGCSNSAIDFWYSSNYTCPSNYVLNLNPTSEIVGSPVCLGVLFYKENRIRDRYKQITGCSNNFDFQSHAVAFSNSINNYASQSEKIIKEDIQTSLKELNNQYNNTAIKIHDAFLSVKNLIDPFIVILQDVLGDSGIYQLMNCRFLPLNVAIILKAFNLTGKSMVELSAAIASLAIINWLLMFFGLIIIFRKATTIKFRQARAVYTEPITENQFQPNKLEVN